MCVVCIFLMLTLMNNQVSAQVVNLSDSLKKAWSYSPNFSAKLDSRHSFITGKSARIFGVKAGISWNKTFSIGLGYSWLSSELIGYSDDLLMEPGRIRFRFVGPYLDYRFYKKGPWEARIPAQIGFGKSFLEREVDGEVTRFKEGSTMLYEPAMVVEYSVLGIVGFGGGIGYRLMLVNNKELDQRFTSPIYMFWVRLIPEGITEKLRLQQ